MDRLVTELIALLRQILAAQQRLQRTALARREAMRIFDIDRLETLVEVERGETLTLAELDKRRKELVGQFRNHLGRGVEPTVSRIADKTPEPARSQLLGLAGEIKAAVELLDRNTRINTTVSETLVKGLAKVLKIVTGMAQHAGLYMRNGRKAALRGIHLLEVTA